MKKNHAKFVRQKRNHVDKWAEKKKIHALKIFNPPPPVIANRPPLSIDLKSPVSGQFFSLLYKIIELAVFIILTRIIS